MSDAATAPRLAPPRPREQWDDDVRAALRDRLPGRSPSASSSTGPDALPVPNAIGTMLRHPALAGPFLAYNGVLLFDPALEPRQRELMVLRVAWRTRLGYEWVQHVRLARVRRHARTRSTRSTRYGDASRGRAVVAARSRSARRDRPAHRHAIASTTRPGLAWPSTSTSANWSSSCSSSAPTRASRWRSTASASSSTPTSPPTATRSRPDSEE